MSVEVYKPQGIWDKLCCCFIRIAPDNAEARGFMYTAAARGPVVIFGALFASVAINAFARSVSDCDGRVLNGALDAGSVLSSLGVIEGVLNAVLSPFIGSFADLTPHRKRGLLIGFTTFTVLVLVQAGLFLSTDSDKVDPSEPTEFLQKPLWQSDVALMVLVTTVVIQVVSYEFAALLTATYSPELSTDHDQVSVYVSWSYTLLNGMQLLLVILLIGISFVFGLSSFMLGTVGAIVTAGFTVAWFIPGYRLLGHRREVCEDLNQGCCGLKHMGETAMEIVRNYPELAKLLVSWSIASSSLTSLTVLSTSYLQFHLGYEGFIVQAVLGLALLFSVPGSLLTKYLIKRISLKACYVGFLTVFGLSFIIGPVLLVAETVPLSSIEANSTIPLTQYGFCDTVIAGEADQTKQTSEGYVFIILLGLSAIWGLCLGGSYVSNNALYATMLPGGKEATYFGIKVTCAKALTWLPPLCFTLINEGGDLRWGIMPLGPIFIVAAGIAMTINVEKGREEIADTLHRRRGDNFADSGAMVAKSAGDDL